MKLTILGGGGFRTPFVWQALIRDQASPRVTEVSLHDVDQVRLTVIHAILDSLTQESGAIDPPTLSITTDAREALSGADFVFAAVRAGGPEGRSLDEHVALDLGVIGQETTGPGGLAYALRSVPVMLDYARIIAEVAPRAYVMNFTNPAGIVTEAMQSILGDRVLGICDTPSGMGRRIVLAAGADPEATEVAYDYIGLNHLGWMRRVLVDGVDVLPGVLADGAALQDLEEAHVFGADWLRTLGVVPNEYLYYYDRQREALASITSALASGEPTRGDFLVTQQEDFYAAAAADLPGALDRWRATVAEREASYMVEATGGTQGAPAYARGVETDPSKQGYAGVALAVMAAIARGEQSTLILNVRNGDAIPGMPSDAVVEVACLVDGSGVHPLAQAAPSLAQLGLMLRVKAVERHIIAAVATRSRREAELAFAEHPLVDSVVVAKELLARYEAVHPAIAGLWSDPV